MFSSSAATRLSFSFSSEEEKSRCQEVICKLQSTLDSEREKSAFVSEQRLKLQQENEQLQNEMEGLRKLAVEAQQKAKIKVCFIWVFLLCKTNICLARQQFKIKALNA